MDSAAIVVCSAGKHPGNESNKVYHGTEVLLQAERKLEAMPARDRLQNGDYGCKMLPG
jgi:hypothetical protein